MKKWKARARKAFKKVVELVNKPVVRKTSKMASSLLNTIYLVKAKNPISVITASLSVVNSFADAFELPRSSKVDAFIKSNELVTHFGSLPYLIASSRLPEKLDTAIVLETEEIELVSFDVNGKYIYFTQWKKKAITYGEDGHKFDRFFYAPEDFDFEEIFTMIWKCYDDGVYLCRNQKSHKLELSALPTEDLTYIGPHDINVFSEELNTFFKNGHSRSYMFCGPPGAGKTTFALQLATANFKRVLRIDPSVVKSLASGELEFFIMQLCPRIILFDDFDRAYFRGEVGPILSMLENIKRMFPNTVMIATVNNFEKLDSAIYRPGRFDEVLWFENPNESYRKEIFQFYADKYGVDIPEKWLADLIKKSKGFAPVYLKELVIRISAYSGDIEQNIQRAIQDFEKRISAQNSNHTSEDEYDDDDMFDEDDDIDEYLAQVRDRPEEHTGSLVEVEVHIGDDPDDL